MGHHATQFRTTSIENATNFEKQRAIIRLNAGAMTVRIDFDQGWNSIPGLTRLRGDSSRLLNGVHHDGQCSTLLPECEHSVQLIGSYTYRVQYVVHSGRSESLGLLQSRYGRGPAGCAHQASRDLDALGRFQMRSQWHAELVYLLIQPRDIPVHAHCVEQQAWGLKLGKCR